MEPTDALGQCGISRAQNLPGGSIRLRAVLSHTVEPKQVGRGLVEEVVDRGEAFGLIELRFDEIVDRLHIGSPRLGTRGDGGVDGSSLLDLKGERRVVSGVPRTDELRAIGATTTMRSSA